MTKLLLQNKLTIAVLALLFFALAPMQSIAQKKIAYLTFDKAMGAGASTADNDAIIRMFNADSRFDLTVLKDDGNGSSAVNLSQYDLLIVQETFSSSANILKPDGLLGIKNLTIPVIYNKVYALKSGKGNITTTSGAGDATDLAVTIPTANKSNPLFTGITFSGDDIAIFNAQAADDGVAGGTKSLQYGSGLELTTTGTCLATLASQTISPDTSVVINDIPGGTQFGTATTDVLPSTSRMIAFNMNYGAMAYGDGTNLTANALKLWENAAVILTGLNAPVAAKKVAYLTLDKAMGAGASTVDNDAIIRMLNADTRFDLTVLKDDGNGSSAVNLSQYDLLIVQETFSSSANILKPDGLLGIKNLTIPVIYNKVYALKSGKGNITTTSGAGDATDLAVTIPTANKSNPLFTGITFSGDDIAIFNAQAADDGVAGGTKSLQYGSGLELTTTGTCLATLASQTISPDTSVVINDIPGGTQFGTATTDVLPSTSRMIAFNMNYGAMAYGDGTNLTANALKLWENAALILTGQLGTSLGVKENKTAAISVSVYPNPTSGVVTVNSDSAVETITAYDITGKQVASSNSDSVNLSGNASGLYFLQIQTEAGSATKKVIVE